MPVDLSTVHIPRLPYLDELALIVTGRASDHHVWPPPGMTRLAPFGSVSYALTGTPDEQGWWWSTAEEINPAITGVENVLSAARWAGIEVSAAVRAAVEVLGWVPLVYEWRGSGMEWIKVGIHAQVGTSEQMIHTISLTPSGATPAPLPADGAALRVVADQVATAWAGMFTALQPPFTNPTEDFRYGIGTHVTYDAVTASVLRQTVVSPKVYVKGQANLTETVVPTERVNFATPAVGGAVDVALPYEVAMACTLLTRSAGPSNRGRLYLGGLLVSAVSGHDGLFTDLAVRQLGYGVGKFVETMRTDTDWQVSIVSRRTLTSHEVVRVATGHVPDAQRRRRNGQAENRVTQWTSPTI